MTIWKIRRFYGHGHGRTPPHYLIRYNYHDYVISYVIIKNQKQI